MNKVLAQRKSEREKAIGTAVSYAHKLKETLGPLTAILHGSFARGDFNIGSDIDLIIISDSLPAHPLARMELLYSVIQGGIEAKGYTRAEFLNLLGRKNPIALDASKNGVVLSDDGFWETIENDLRHWG